MRTLVIVLAACGGGSGGGLPGEVDREVTAGRVCLFASDPANGIPGAQSFEADRPIVAQFSILECLSSSCTEDPAASCTVVAQGAQTFAIEGIATWIDTSGTDKACTDDCGQLAATCDTPPLPAGTYEILHAGQSVTLTVPSQLAEPPCTR